MQSEAKAYVGSMNRGQQAVYMENGKFSVPAGTTDAEIETAFAGLGLGISKLTDNYQYGIVPLTGADVTAVANTAAPIVLNAAGTAPDTAVKAAVKAYQGAVKVGSTSANGEATTLAVLCEALQSPIATGDPGTVPAMTATDAPTAGAPKCDTTKYKTIK